jgi:hypothetical protein
MSYIGVPPFGQTVRTVTTIIATADQTTFTPNGGYTAGYIDVYYNGVKLVAGTDFTASNGLTITLTTGATSNAVIETVTYGSVQMTDAVRRSGDTFAGAVFFPNNVIHAANGNLGIGNTVPAAPLVIGAASGSFTNPLVQAASNANSWIQINAQNLNNGNNASTDLVLARSDSTDTTNFIDVGINSNAYSQAAFSIMQPGSGYVFVNGGDLSIGTQTNNNIIFHTGNTTAASEKLRINTTGAIILAGGNVAANGVGIAFPNTQVTTTDPNTLDDYEKGTWSPYAYGSTAAGTGTYSATNNKGAYVKIGSLVTAYFSLNCTSTHNGTGLLFIGGLPFSNYGYTWVSGSVGYWASLLTTTATYVGCYIDPGSSGVVVTYTNSATAGVSYLSPAAIQSGTHIIGSVTYRVA